MSSIFVQIAAYQDYELPRTILDCIKNISEGNNVNFGIHLCYEKDDIVMPDLKNIKFEKSKSPKNLGVGIARNIANSFYDGEDYYLQIDSHTRFDKGWDELLINDYNAYKVEGCKPLISSYPSGYKYVDYVAVKDKNPNVVKADFERTESAKQLFKTSKFINQESSLNTDGNLFTKTVSGGSIFSDGSIASISPNVKMFNWGEEFLAAIRFYTHGYDLMLPSKQSIYHLYFNPEDPFSSQRVLPHINFPNENSLVYQQSNEELARILGGRIIGDQELGSERTLDEYGYYAGLDFTNYTIHDIIEYQGE